MGPRVPDGPSKASVMEAALERIGRDAGVAAFWQELKRGSDKATVATARATIRTRAHSRTEARAGRREADTKRSTATLRVATFQRTHWVRTAGIPTLQNHPGPRAQYPNTSRGRS